jgi:hypothetical protein
VASQCHSATLQARCPLPAARCPLPAALLLASPRSPSLPLASPPAARSAHSSPRLFISSLRRRSLAERAARCTRILARATRSPQGKEAARSFRAGSLATPCAHSSTLLLPFSAALLRCSKAPSFLWQRNFSVCTNDDALAVNPGRGGCGSLRALLDEHPQAPPAAARAVRHLHAPAGHGPASAAHKAAGHWRVFRSGHWRHAHKGGILRARPRPRHAHAEKGALGARGARAMAHKAGQHPPACGLHPRHAKVRRHGCARRLPVLPPSRPRGHLPLHTLRDTPHGGRTEARAKARPGGGHAHHLRNGRGGPQGQLFGDLDRSAPPLLLLSLHPFQRSFASRRAPFFR